MIMSMGTSRTSVVLSSWPISGQAKTAHRIKVVCEILKSEMIDANVPCNWRWVIEPSKRSQVNDVRLLLKTNKVTVTVIAQLRGE